LSSRDSWDEFFERLAREIEHRVREAFSQPGMLFEPALTDFRKPFYDAAVQGENYYLVVVMPGADKKKIEVMAEESKITVVAEYVSPPYSEALNMHPFRRGKGYRLTVNTPRPIDPSKVEAKYEEGILYIKAFFASPRGYKINIE